MATTTTRVSKETARRLAELKPSGATYDEVVAVAISGKSRDEVARVLKERTSFFTFSGLDDAALEKGRVSPRLRSELKRRAYQPRMSGEEVTRRNGLDV